MECRRWAPIRDLALNLFFFSWILMECWIDGLGRCSAGIVGMRVSNSLGLNDFKY